MRRRAAAKTLGLLVACALTPARAPAEGLSGGAFAAVDFGARAAALAGANVADPRGGEAMIWNPAALALFRQHHLETSSADLYGLGLVRQIHLAATAPAEEQGGGSGLELRYLGIEGFDPEGDEVDDPGYRELSFGCGHARSFGSLALGAAARLELARGSLEERDDVSATGAALDLGLLWRLARDLRTGLLLRNVAAGTFWDRSGSGFERRPLSLALGLTWKEILPGVRLAADLESGEELGAALGGVARQVALSAEWRGFDERLELRTGSALRIHGDDTRPIHGAGFGLALGSLDVRYAATIDDEGLGTTHRFGLGLRW